MRKRIFTIMMCMCCIFALSACGGDKEDSSEEKEISAETETSEGETSETSAETGTTIVETTIIETTVPETSETTNESETTEEIMDFGVNVGTAWKYAYNDDTYIFYYLKESEEVYNKNIVMSITDDDNLAGLDAETLKESLEEQNEDAKVEVSGETAGGNEVVYVQLEETNGEAKAYVGQYIVLGEEECLIFSVYAEESRFEAARQSARSVVDAVGIE